MKQTVIPVALTFLSVEFTVEDRPYHSGQKTSCAVERNFITPSDLKDPEEPAAVTS
jgi:hypothetical protein